MQHHCLNFLSEAQDLFGSSAILQWTCVDIDYYFLNMGSAKLFVFLLDELSEIHLFLITSERPSLFRGVSSSVEIRLYSRDKTVN